MFIKCIIENTMYLFYILLLQRYIVGLKDLFSLVLVLLLEEYRVVAGIKSWHIRHFGRKRHKSTCKESIKHRMDFSTIVWKRRTIDIGLWGDCGATFLYEGVYFYEEKSIEMHILPSHARV